MNAELALLRKEREARRKLIVDCSKRVDGLEALVQTFIQDVQLAEKTNTIGKERAQFQERANLLNSQGTVHILKVDSIQATSEEERPKARSERKKLVQRIEACSAKLLSFA